MSGALAAPRVAGRPALRSRAGVSVLFLYQAAVLFAFAAVPFLALRWLDTPFIGGLVEDTLALSPLQPGRPGAWALTGGDLAGARLLAVDGQPVSDPARLDELLRRYPAGQEVTLSLAAAHGEPLSRAVRLETFPQADRVAFLYIPYLVGLVYLGSGLWVFFLKRRDAAGGAFSLFAASAAFSLAGFFEHYTTHLLTPVWLLSLALAGGSLFHLALSFPQELALAARLPFLRPGGYLLALVLVFGGRLAPGLPPAGAWRAGLAWVGAGAAAFLALTTARWLRSHSPILREQARLLLWGTAIALTPLALWLFFSRLLHLRLLLARVPLALAPAGLPFSGLLLLPLSVFPVLLAYTLLRYRFLNAGAVLSQISLYALLSALVGGSYALLVGGASLIAGQSLPASHPALIGLLALGLAVGLNPLRRVLQQRVEAAFFRGRVAYRERLQTFSGKLTQSMDLAGILAALREHTSQVLYPWPVHIFIHDALSDTYTATPDESGRPSSELRFTAGSPLIQSLSAQRAPIILFSDKHEDLPAALHGERARLALLDAQLIVPLDSPTRLAGWIALGPRRSGKPYDQADLNYLEALSDQAVLAIERLQVVADLERRVHEMRVLARVAQGINVTLAYDDLLELLYTQVDQVVPCRDFRILLNDPGSETYTYVFFLEDNERRSERENLPILAGDALEIEVVRGRRALISADYESERRARGLPPAESGLFAWIGIPLNAGDGTIGALSLGSRSPTQTYTADQCSLLQAIADQAAGAMVKARLLQETERRARQLATLNEIGRSLTSTLALQPLLGQILDSAARIIDCEAGSLFRVDEANGELVFEVTVGPVASDLVGQRLPAGTGLVGKAVASGKPLIANDARRKKGWFGAADQKTGFVTRDLLVAPMQVKERVIGVIEVINKKDGSPFVADDRDLLATFASQAAVAVENARLYTQTDEALAARVKELSVMQRIDQELNAGLDVSRAMRLALEWALGQSGAEAGLAGAPRDGTLEVIAAQGYPLEVFASPEQGDEPAPHPLVSLPSIREVLGSGQPLRRWFSRPAGGAADLPERLALLGGTLSQIVLPIRREEQVIGLLLLESRRADFGSEELLAFLARLSDHAAIAIANAQLYQAAQDADRAKSEFVSFVSHELKTPMTSIKGYADLLAGGAAGPISELQSSFLDTIRSNVVRMATLVSDLSDVSRIESGRLRLDFRAVAVGEVVEEVVRGQRALLEAKEQPLECHIPADLPQVWGDALRFGQVLTNLVSNANKYSPPGAAITITAGRDRQVKAPGAAEFIHLSIRDRGYGIQPEDQQKIFQKFFRSEDQNIRESPGTGLGLNITRALVELQGGQIWFETEPGAGTTFHFTLPVASS